MSHSDNCIMLKHFQLLLVSGSVLADFQAVSHFELELSLTPNPAVENCQQNYSQTFSDINMVRISGFNTCKFSCLLAFPRMKPGLRSQQKTVQCTHSWAAITHSL